MQHTPYVPPSERATESALAVPGLKRTAVILGRALRLRCPNCGGGRVVQGWTRIRERCEACGFRFHRGDAEYYSAGVIFTNIAVAEGIFAVIFVVALLATWPDVPWDALTYGSMFLMVALPVLLYPFCKVVWLAVDTLVRPVTPEEFEGR